MSQVVTENFRKSLYSSPTGKRKNGTIFDDLRNSLETSEKPLDRAVQMIAEYHGPWTGSSVELTKFSSFVGGKLGNGAKIKNQTSENLAGASSVNNAIKQMPPSAVGKSNPQTCAIMPTPLLRQFVNQAQKMHPAINMYIQNNIYTFPYFQQTSEDVGSFASIAQNKTSIDPMKWPNLNGVNCLDTNSRMNKNTQLKMANSIFNLMDTSSNLLNALFLRSMPKGNNMSFMHPNYSSEAPIAHGHNYSMDVFNGQRNVDALEGAMAAVLSSSSISSSSVLVSVNSIMSPKKLNLHIQVDNLVLRYNMDLYKENLLFYTGKLVLQETLNLQVFHVKILLLHLQ